VIDDILDYLVAGNHSVLNASYVIDAGEHWSTLHIRSCLFTLCRQQQMSSFS